MVRACGGSPVECWELEQPASCDESEELLATGNKERDVQTGGVPCRNITAPTACVGEIRSEASAHARNAVRVRRWVGHRMVVSDGGGRCASHHAQKERPPEPGGGGGVPCGSAVAPLSKPRGKRRVSKKQAAATWVAGGKA